MGAGYYIYMRVFSFIFTAYIHFILSTRLAKNDFIILDLFQENRIHTMSSTEGIPIRRLVVHDPKDMPLHYGETPGGSIFSTTPGGREKRRAFVLMLFQ